MVSPRSGDQWRSSRLSKACGMCAEARTTEAAWLVRDSKEVARGIVDNWVSFTPAQFRRYRDTVEASINLGLAGPLSEWFHHQHDGTFNFSNPDDERSQILNLTEAESYAFVLGMLKRDEDEPDLRFDELYLLSVS